MKSLNPSDKTSLDEDQNLRLEIDSYFEHYWADFHIARKTTHDPNRVNEYLEISKQNDNHLGVAQAQAILAYYYLNQYYEHHAELFTLVKAALLISRALPIFKSQEKKKFQMYCYHIMSFVGYCISNNEMRLDYNQKVFDLSVEIDDIRFQYFSLYNLGDVYYNLGDFDRAYSFFLKGEKLNLDMPSIQGLYSVGKARILFQKKDFLSSNIELEKSIELLNNNKHIAYAYMIKGRIFQNQNKLKEAEQNLSLSIELFEKNQIFDELSTLYVSLSEVYSLQEKWRESNLMLNKHIALFNKKTSAKPIKIIDRIEKEDKLDKIVAEGQQKKNHNEILSKAIEKLEVEKKQLKRNNDLLKNFANVASHDMKEPLRTINSFSKLLYKSIDEKASDDEKEFMSFIISSSDRLNTMIDDLLEYSKLDKGKIIYQTFSSQKVFDEVFLDLHNLVKKNNTHISFLNMPELYGNEKLLKRLFHSIVRNALTFTDTNKRNEIEIDITLDSNYQKIHIKDNGIGIEKNQLETVFKMFYQVHGNNNAYGGSGLGLSISQQIAHLHKGYIKIESFLNQGTLIIIFIPKIIL